MRLKGVSWAGLPTVVIKRTFWMFLAASLLSLIPAALLNDFFTTTLTALLPDSIASFAMFFLGYIISFSCIVFIYEYFKTGRNRLNVARVKRMSMAWLRTILITLPVMIALVIIGLIGLAVLFTVSTYLGGLVILVAILGMVMLIPISIVLQWYWYEKGA